MNELIKKMFEKGNEDMPMYFEALSGQLPKFMQRNGIIEAGENSVSQNGFIGSPMKNVSTLKKLTMLPMGLKLYNQIKKSLTIPENTPTRNIIFYDELIELELYFKELEILSFGYTKVDRDNIFLDRGILFDNAIVISIKMPIDKVNKAPSLETMEMVEDTYAQTGDVTNKITDYLRKKGFGAQSGPGLGGMTIYPLLAKEAKMGEIGRHGLLITPQNGSSQRLAVVYTNISNFPIKEKNVHSWIQDFCKDCGICIKKCPSKAIYNEPKKINNKHISHIKYNKCMTYFNDNYGCTICVKVCPFTKTGYEKLFSNYTKKTYQKISN